jgi:drug/metabolite transporter (DMT)-like permease
LFKLYLLAALVQILWALTPSASSVVISQIPVELFIATRWTISGLIFLLVAYFTKQKIDLHPKMLKRYFILGVVGYGLSSIGCLYGLKLGGVVNFALLSSVNPIVTATLSIWILKEKVKKKYWIAAPLCVIGLFVMVLGKYELSGTKVAFGSVLLILLAYFLEALPFVYSKKYEKRQSLISYMAILQLSAASFMWGTQALYFKQLSEFKNLNLMGLLSMLFVSVVACVICYALLYWLLKYIDGHRLAIFDGVHSIFAAFYGVLFFSEAFNLTMLFGASFLLIALYLANAPSNENISERIAAENI